LVFGLWSLVFGLWSLVIGHWSLVILSSVHLAARDRFTTHHSPPTFPSFGKVFPPREKRFLSPPLTSRLFSALLKNVIASEIAPYIDGVKLFSLGTMIA
jgi:hypothetical protein